MQTFAIFLLFGLANARLSDDKCKEYNEKPLSNGSSLINNFPHMGLLTYRKHNSTQYMCSATLIDGSTAIVGAYCILNSTEFQLKGALFGTLNSNEKGDNYQSVDVVQTIVHPQYQNISRAHNIALVKFSAPITPDDYIRPGCLYSKNIEDNQILVRLLWGNNAEDKNLFKVNSSIVSIPSCQSSYGKIAKISAQYNICTTKNFPDKYRRHVGGTSHVYEDGLPKIAAIDSFGLPASRPNIPDVSTTIYSYLDWIEQNAWGKD